MAQITAEKVEEILNGFGEVMSRLMVDQLQKNLSELDLTLPQVQVLRILRRCEALPTGKLALGLKISAPATTQLTDRLIRKGLIERQPAADDRRTVLVALSAKGKNLVDQFRQRRNAIFSGALAQLSEAEQCEVITALEKIIAALETFEAKAGRDERDIGTEIQQGEEGK